MACRVARLLDEKGRVGLPPLSGPVSLMVHYESLIHRYDPVRRRACHEGCALRHHGVVP